MKYVKWIELGEDGEPLVNMIPVTEAIDLTKRYGFYDSDQEALDEFVIVNCAEFVDVEDNQVTRTNE